MGRTISVAFYFGLKELESIIEFVELFFDFIDEGYLNVLPTELGEALLFDILVYFFDNFTQIFRSLNFILLQQSTHAVLNVLLHFLRVVLLKFLAFLL